MANSPSAAFLRLRQTIAKCMRMNHIDQPLMLMELLGRRSPAPEQDVAKRILGSAWWAGFTFNGITADGDGHDATSCLSSAGNVSTHSEAIGMLHALFFGLMEKAESPQGERESRSDRVDNRGWRRCRCSSPPSRSKAQRETA
ncbi:MAG: hypothetical protein HQ527_00730 [Cyanobacteria bacterium]|nr:hypothetical protein [Cyanobacteria bacterium bin.51]